MTNKIAFSETPYVGFGSGPFEAGADSFAAANGFQTKVAANTSTHLVEGLVATSLANGYASGYLPTSAGAPPSASVFVDASVSGTGSTHYGFDVDYGGGINGIVVHDAATQYQALQNFSAFSSGGFDIFG